MRDFEFSSFLKILVQKKALLLGSAFFNLYQDTMNHVRIIIFSYVMRKELPCLRGVTVLNQAVRFGHHPCRGLS